MWERMRERERGPRARARRGEAPFILEVGSRLPRCYVRGINTRHPDRSPSHPLPLPARSACLPSLPAKPAKSRWSPGSAEWLPDSRFRSNTIQDRFPITSRALVPPEFGDLAFHLVLVKHTPSSLPPPFPPPSPLPPTLPPTSRRGMTRSTLTSFRPVARAVEKKKEKKKGGKKKQKGKVQVARFGTLDRGQTTHPRRIVRVYQTTLLSRGPVSALEIIYPPIRPGGARGPRFSTCRGESVVRAPLCFRVFARSRTQSDNAWSV